MIKPRIEHNQFGGAMAWVHYGDEKIEFVIPKSWNVIAFAQQPRIDVGNEKETIRVGLENPIGQERLSKLAKDRRNKIVIISDDANRPTPAWKIIPLILNQLKEIEEHEITFVIGKGTHPEPKPQELRMKLGDEIVDRFNTVIHNPDENLVYLGKTSRGTPIWINELVAKARLKIGIGSIMPHMTAGFGGGAKIILPGVSGRESIINNHTLAVDRRARVGRVEDNPLRADMEEVAKVAGLNFIINTILDEKKRILKVVSGNFISAHREGVNEFRRLFEARVSSLCDLTITSSYPLETYFFQAMKSVVYADQITKDGGTIVWVTSTREGLGEEYVRLASQVHDPDTMLKTIRERKIEGTLFEPFVYPTIDFESAYLLLDILRRKHIIAVSKELPEKILNEIGIMHALSVDEAIELSGYKRESADIAVLPAGGSTLPTLASMR